MTFGTFLPLVACNDLCTIVFIFTLIAISLGWLAGPIIGIVAANIFVILIFCIQCNMQHLLSWDVVQKATSVISKQSLLGEQIARMENSAQTTAIIEPTVNRNPLYEVEIIQKSGYHAPIVTPTQSTTSTLQSRPFVSKTNDDSSANNSGLLLVHAHIVTEASVPFDSKGDSDESSLLGIYIPSPSNDSSDGNEGSEVEQVDVKSRTQVNVGLPTLKEGSAEDRDTDDPYNASDEYSSSSEEKIPGGTKKRSSSWESLETDSTIAAKFDEGTKSR